MIIFSNSHFGTGIGGGDLHLFGIIKRAKIHTVILGSSSLKKKLKENGVPYTGFIETSTKSGLSDSGLWNQIVLFLDYFMRCLRSCCPLPHDEFAYAASDGWFDAIPLFFSRARRKFMICHIVPPVEGKSFLANIHFKLGWRLSHWLFKRLEHKRLFYVHSDMKETLLKFGYKESDLVFLSAGIDVETAEKAFSVNDRNYDAVWIGRIHPQKGIDDLISTVKLLAFKIPNFRMAMIGSKKQIEELLFKNGLRNHVHIYERVSEENKFLILKCSKVFLMPSHYESFGSVIAEAIVCGLSVVAYKLKAYKTVFGDMIQTVRCFDKLEFYIKAHDAIIKARENRPQYRNLDDFKRQFSYQSITETFLKTINQNI